MKNSEFRESIKKALRLITESATKTNVIYGCIDNEGGASYRSTNISLDLTTYEKFKDSYEYLDDYGDVVCPNDDADYKKIYKALVSKKEIAVVDTYGEGVVSFGFDKSKVKQAAQRLDSTLG